MLTLLAALGVILDLTIRAIDACKRHLVQPLLTAVLLTGAYAVVHIGHEGGVTDGLRSAFWTNVQTPTAHPQENPEDRLQAELRHFAAVNKLIDQHLQTLPTKAGASRVRLGVIHNGVTGLTGMGLLRYDITNSVAAPGRSTGESVRNLPLADWGDFLPTLLTDQCVLSRVADLKAIAIRAQFEAFGAANVLVCPASDIQARAIGALFLFWDVGDPVPKGDALTSLMTLTRGIAGHTATVFAMRQSDPCEVKQASDG